MPSLLYIGQAVKAHQRRAGVHDCKTYVDNYISANYQHQQQTAVCTAFWWNTPRALTPRLQLEASLIAQWRSLFNKENRKYWATPVHPAQLTHAKRGLVKSIKLSNCNRIRGYT